jgi:ABC-type transport system substrate-binding protein
VSWDPQSKVVLIKNPTFREVHFPAAKDIDEDFVESRVYAGRRLPLVDNLTFRVISEDQPRWLEHIAGNVDQIEIPKDNLANAVKADDIRSLKDEWAQKGFKLSAEEGVVHWYMFLNMKDKLLGENKLLRQAMSAAFDRQGFLNLHRNGRGSVAAELNPTGTNDRCGKRTEPKFPYSIEKAKELLAKAGYPEGKGLPVINLDMRGADSTARQLAEFVTKSMAAANIKINPQLNTFPAFLDKRQKGNLQFAMGGWNMDYPDAENNLQLFYGPNEAPGPNESNYKNPKYDELYKKVAMMASGPARQALVCQMDDMLQEDAPMILSHYESLYRMVSPKLRNYHTYEMAQNKYKFMDIVEPAKH